MGKLTVDDFKPVDFGNGGAHIKHTKPNGDTICLENCLNGFCVVWRTEGRELVVPKVCTDIKGNSIRYMKPASILKRAIEVANEMIGEK